jgi:hypothetical protein
MERGREGNSKFCRSDTVSIRFIRLLKHEFHSINIKLMPDLRLLSSVSRYQCIDSTALFANFSGDLTFGFPIVLILSIFIVYYYAK